MDDLLPRVLDDVIKSVRRRDPIDARGLLKRREPHPLPDVHIFLHETARINVFNAFEARAMVFLENILDILEVVVFGHQSKSFEFVVS